MPGFPLAALGAGLGLWVKNQQEQQAQRERQQMLALQLQNYQQQMQDRQRDRLGQDELGRLDLSGPGGGTGINPVNPMGGSSGGVGVPIPAALGFDAARGQQGGAPPRSPGDAWLQQNAPFPTQGRTGPQPEMNTSKLPWTNNTPEPDAYAQASGPGAPTEGPSPPPNTAGMKMSPDSTNAPPMRMAGASGASAPQGDLAAQIAKIPMPSLPNLDIEAKRRQINQQAPHAPWERKEQALRDWISAHGKEAERQYDQSMKLYENQRSVVIEQWRENHSDAQWQQRHGVERREKLDDRDATGGTITTGPAGEAFNVQGAGARPIIRTDTGEPLVKEGAKKASSNISIVDAEGKNIFKGSAHPDPSAKEGESSWIDDKTQKRIEVPPDANLTIVGKGGEGRQAAAQMIRLTSAANEARRQIGNVAEMTVGATTSWFQGLQSSAGKDLAEGLKRTLANQITPRDEQMMSALGRGIGRSLASLETAGAATGLVNLQESMGSLMPAKGDDRATILMKIAEMRQIAEQGIESAMAAPAVGDEQKKLLRDVRDDVAKAVPFTVPDVIRLVRKPGAETYQSFAAKIGLGKPGGAAAAGEPAPAAGVAAGPKEGDIATAPGKPDLVFRGGVWVPQ